MEQRIFLKAPGLADSADELVVEVYYSVSEGGSTELAGIGTIILFDSNQLNFLRYEEIYKTDLFQAPTSVYTEKSLYDSLTSSGKTVNIDLDSIEATKSGIPFAYLTGSDLLFDGKEETKWDGVVRWPGANIVEAKSYPGVKLFNLVFKPTVDFKDTTLSALVTTSAEGYNGKTFNANTKINTPSVVTGQTSESGTEDNLIVGKLKIEDVAGIFNVSLLENSQAKNGTVKLKTLTDKTPLSGIGYGTSIDWEYQPNDNYFGNDSFTLSITDNLNKTTQQKIGVSISPVDDPAVITGNKSGSGDANKPIKGKLSATDKDGLTDETIFSIASADYPKNGTSTVNAKTGDWEYIPKENFADNDSFAITITDDLGGISRETINVSINSPGQTNIPSEIKLLDDPDGITKNPNPTITGKAEPGAKIEIFKGDISFGNATANSDGLWNLALARALDQGSNEFKAYATVGSKLISKASLPLQLILDSTMPVLTISAKDSQGNSISRLFVGQSALLSFKFSEATAANSFTKEDIIASDGVQPLGSINEFKKDESDPTLFTAILTPAANLISDGTILVSAGSVEDLGGNKNIATSIPFSVITGTSYAINNGVTGDSAPLIQQEGTGTLETSYTFKISRSGDTRAAGNVKWTVIGNDSASSTGRASASDFVDGNMPSGIVAFAADDTETKTITIKVKQDSTFELDEIFRVELSDPTSTNTSLIANLAPGKAVANSIIINDDAPPLRPVVNNPAFDLIGLTDLRNDPKYSSIDGRAPILTGESTQNYKNFTIAVLDSGVDGSHDRLKYDETHSQINSKDSSKFVGYIDFVNKQSSGTARVVSTSASTFIDNIGHGTHVAGTVGSSDPAIGVAPGVQLLGLRVGDQSMSYSDIMEALTWVKDNRTDFNIVAVNMSLGGDYYNQRPDGGNDSLYNSVRKLINELEDIGVTVVSAAGNDYFSNHTDDKMRENIAIPAIASSLAVGAVWKDGAARNVQWGGGSIDITTGADRIASFSQRLNNYDGMIFAPGAFIPSTVPGNKVENKGGTSMASPIVAGAVALLQDAALTFGARLLSPREVTGVLERTAKRIFDGDDENTNVTATFKEYRRMDLYAAVKQVEAMFKTPTGGGSKTLYYFTYNYGNGDSYSGYGIAKDSNSIYAAGITSNSVENSTTTTNGTVNSGNGAYSITGTLLGATGIEGDVVITSYFDGDTGAGFAGTVYGGGKTGLGSEAGDAFLASGESYDSSFTPNQEADLVQNAFLDIQKYSFIYRYSNKVAFNVNENTIAAALLDGYTSGFAIVGGADQNLFNIGINGALSFKAAPNFESTLAADGTNTYHVNVKSTETATINGNSQTVGVLNELSLTIIDLNESPNFKETSAIYSIAENTTKIATIQATDPDLADVLAFSIGADSSNLFQINPTTGELSFTTAPNYEDLLAQGKTSFDVSIAVRDLGGLSVTKGLRISITDVDEFDVAFSNPADADSGKVTGSDGSPNPPQIGAGDDLSYDGSVRENAANGTLVGISANAIDADATNNVISYSLSDNAGGRFAIDSTTGAVSVANGSLIDFDDQPTPGDGVFSTNHTIKAKATSEDGSFIENSFTIAVENVREDLPFFNSSTNIIINENELSVTNFTSTSQAATDPDGQGSPLSYSIINGRDSNLFEINATNGTLKFKQDQAPNFESPTDTGKDNTYALNIKVTDGSEDVETANITQLVTVRVRDVDEFDASQPTDNNSSINSVIENALPGTLVGITASSIDADATNNLISYSLTDSASDTFIINPLTGVVNVLNPALLDYETNTDKSISFTVKATSADGSNASQTFKLDITNVNESFTIDTATNFTFSEANTNTIASISSTDQDGSSNYTYKIIENQKDNLPQDDWNMFSVSTTGELSFKSTPDYENPQDLDADNTYTFNLEITDTVPSNASGSPISRIEKITVDVTDIVERPERITGFLGADGKTSSTTIEAELYQGSGFSLGTTYATSQQVLAIMVFTLLLVFSNKGYLQRKRT